MTIEVSPHLPTYTYPLNFAGVCSLIEAKECHQIAHCQLVIGDQDQCSCQDDSCSGKEGQEIVSFSSSAVAQPVCGSDHVTYRDVCQLKNAACTKHLNITQIAGVPCGTCNRYQPNINFCLDGEKITYKVVAFFRIEKGRSELAQFTDIYDSTPIFFHYIVQLYIYMDFIVREYWAGL